MTTYQATVQVKSALVHLPKLFSLPNDTFIRKMWSKKHLAFSYSYHGSK